MRVGIQLFAIAIGLLGAAGARAAEALQIDYAEPIAITAAPGAVKFEAYGRELTLQLESNDRLVQGMPGARKASISSIQLLRGKVSGNPGSWVRLTTDGNQVAGGIWDGTDLYLVARHRDIAAYLTNPLQAAPDATVVYRLADTTNFLPEGFCATGTSGDGSVSKNGLAQYKAMIQEFKLTFVAEPTDQLDISLIADSGVVQAYASPNDNLNLRMLDAVNLVDGIYDSQLGLMITASDLRTLPGSSDPFTANDSSGLLAQLRDFRSSIPAVQSKAVAHLLTSRSLDGGSTLGVAYLDGACDATKGVSLTSAPNGSISNSFMVIAHELGHNLGAQHDTAACGDTHIMWPEYSYEIRPTFSQCSVEQIKPFIAAHRGACITSPSYGDVAARVGTIASPLQTEAFTWPVYVKNLGTAAITNAVAAVSIRNHDPLTAVPTQGTCAPVNHQTVCQLGTLAPGGEVRIDLPLSTNFLETLDLSVASNATNDRYENNNVVYGSVTVQPRATLDTSVTPATASANVGDIVEYVYTLTASGPRASRNAQLQFGGDSSLDVVSASATQGTCTTDKCLLGDIPTGASAKVTLRVKSTQGAAHTLSAQTQAEFTQLLHQNVNATLNATATYDLAIESPGNQLLAVDAPFTLTIPIRANGTRPVSGGVLRMNLPADITSLEIDGVACAPALLFGTGCPLGTLNPGQVKTARLTAVFHAPTETGVYIGAEILNDELWSNNSANLVFRVRYATDVTLETPVGSGAVEGRQFDAVTVLTSLGAQSATNVSSTLDVPVGLRVVSASLSQGTCAIVTERRVTCTLGLLALDEQREMRVRLVGDQPASYSGTWSVTAANDGVPGNNSVAAAILVRPLTDIRLNAIATLPGFVIGIPREFTIEVYAGGTRPAENVVVNLFSIDGLVLEGVSTPTGTCTLTGTRPKCSLGTLAPDSLVRVVPRYRATRSGTGGSAWVNVTANDDVDRSNNDRDVRLNTYEAGDVAVRVAGSTISGVVGDTVDLPRITFETLTRAYDLRFSVSLPPFTTLVGMSGAVLCTGTTVLDCYLGDQSEPGNNRIIDLKVRLDATGTFTTNVVARAGNDTQPSNDSASFQVQATAVATPPPPVVTPPPSGGSKSGGGGRFEWLALVFLASLAANRARRPRLQSGVMSRR
jgi:hypothetical protein